MKNCDASSRLVADSMMPTASAERSRTQPNWTLSPPAGAVLICPPLKIEKGSGSPLRVLALVGAAA